MSRRVVTEGIVIRPYWGGISRKPHTLRYKAHRTECRYARGEGVEPIAAYVESFGHDSLRTKIAVGIVEPCGVCKPVLLREEPEGEGA